jgi:threonylcarbamoyladenosine tRNA methylthiotransferase MtaB
MKRKYTLKQFMELCAYIRKRNKLVSITTDYIVGFPTETSEQFNDSLKNLEQIKFSDMHIFPFSSRPFTVASKLKNVVSDYEKKTRFIAIDKLNKQTQSNYLKQFIGVVVNVLFEHSNKPGVQTGHSEYFFTVNIKTIKVFTNQMLSVKITSLVGDQLFGTLV